MPLAVWTEFEMNHRVGTAVIAVSGHIEYRVMMVAPVL